MTPDEAIRQLVKTLPRLAPDQAKAVNRVIEMLEQRQQVIERCQTVLSERRSIEWHERLKMLDLLHRIMGQDVDANH